MSVHKKHADGTFTVDGEKVAYREVTRDALTRAVEAAATPGRTIIDALAGDSVCHCGRPNAKPRKWLRNGHDTVRGFFCDDCEIALDLARRHLVDGLVTRAWQALERVAS